MQPDWPSRGCFSKSPGLIGDNHTKIINVSIGKNIKCYVTSATMCFFFSDRLGDTRWMEK